MKTKIQTTIFLKVLVILFSFLIIGCDAPFALILEVSGHKPEQPTLLHKAKMIPQKKQYQYREKKPDTALLVLIKYRTSRYTSASITECIYLFEDKSDFMEKIHRKFKYNKYFVACLRPKKKNRNLYPSEWKTAKRNYFRSGKFYNFV